MELILTDGSAVIYDLVKFDVPSHRFYYYDREITNLIYRKDKETFRGFDIEADNRRLHHIKQTGQNPGTVPAALPESTAGAFVEQLATNPLGAPLDALNKGVKQILGTFGVQVIIFGLLVIVFIWAGGLQYLKGKLNK